MQWDGVPNNGWCPNPSGAGREPQGNHPASQGPYVTHLCVDERPKAREMKTCPLLSVSAGITRRRRHRASYGCRTVIVPRVPAETTEDVSRSFGSVRVGSGRQILGPALAKRWAFDAEIPIHMVMPINKAILD